MTNSETRFDAETAEPLLSRVGGSPHNAYKDGNGNVCMHCVSRSGRGGVAVNESGLHWLGDQTGCERFVRLSNYGSKFEVTVKLEDLPHKMMQDDGRGAYAFYDSLDFGAPPPYPPPADQEEVM